MTAYRQRQRAAGLTSFSLVIPLEDAPLFQQMAAERRRLHASRQHKAKVIATEQPRWPPAVRPPASSRADALAEALLRHIGQAGSAVGKALGSESELMQQFSVSRPVLRQAVRLLQHHGVVRMQRGAGGGLIIAAPDAATTARAVRILLEYQQIRPRDILETRRILEQATITLAIERLTEAGRRQLRQVVDAESKLDGAASADLLQRFHFMVADLSGDPALRLFTQIVLHLSLAHSSFERRPRADRDRVVRHIGRLHLRMAAAIMAADSETARHLVARYLEGYRQWIE